MTVPPAGSRAQRHVADRPPSPAAPADAGVIVEPPLLTVRFRNGRRLGTIEEGYRLDPGARRPFLSRA